jgi:hypothetical protein
VNAYDTKWSDSGPIAVTNIFLSTGGYFEVDPSVGCAAFDASNGVAVYVKSTSYLSRSSSTWIYNNYIIFYY